MRPEQLFEENMKLVHYCFKGLPCPPMWREDCIQEGMMELWRVCQRFDSGKGVAFSTYAVPCIRGAMQRFLREKVSVIKIPRTMFEDGTYTNIQIGSLDAVIDDESSNKSTSGDLIPAEPDFYPNLFDDTLEEFLATIPPGSYHDIAEEVLYGCAYGEPPTQAQLAVKYGMSQPNVSRMRTRARKAFRAFLDSIDK